MSVQLARRLLQRGVVSRGILQRALLDSVQRQVGLVQALCDQDPAFAERLERELEPLDIPAIRTVRAVPDLCAGLPPELCEALLAVPVRRDPRSGTVDVAAVDPLDPHISGELSFHLRAPIRVLRAPYPAVRAALQGLQAVIKLGRRPRKREVAEQKTPAFGLPSRPPLTKRMSTLRPAADPVQRRSSRPAAIPLVRRPRKGNEPANREPRPAVGSEPVLTLRPKPQRGPSELPIEALAEARSADEVIDILLSAATEVGSLLIFAARGAAYEGRGGSGPGLFDEQVRKLRLKRSEPSILRTAAQAGYYLGCVPETALHAPIKALLRTGPSDEVYVVPVVVGGKTVIVLLAARFERAFLATRYADRLAAAAAEALERIIRTRKRR